MFRLGGQEVLWPDVTGTLLEMGFNFADIDETNRRARNLAQLGQQWLARADRHTRAAEEAVAAGRSVTAADLYHRAALCYGRGRWSARPPAGLAGIQQRIDASYDAAISHGGWRVERLVVETPVGPINGLLHLPGPSPTPAVGGVVIVPGMDMCKEYFPAPGTNVFVERGVAALVIDPPGHGASMVEGPWLEAGSVEGAIAAAVDVLAARPELADRPAGVVGIGTGASFAFTAAATNTEIAGVAGIEGGFFYEPLEKLANDQPARRARLGRMSGLEGDRLDDLVGGFGVAGLEPSIDCPSLLVIGEFDELTPVEDVERLAAASSPEATFIVWSGEGHVLGGVFFEAIRDVADWSAAVLATMSSGFAGGVQWRES